MSRSPRKSRTLVRIPIEFEGLADDAHIKGKGNTLDLNLNGCRVESHAAVPRGSYVRLRLKIPGSASPVKVDMARVRWVQGGTFGVEFIQRSAEDVPVISQVMAETCEHHGSVVQSIQQRLGGRMGTVLVVEDDPDLLHLCAKTLGDIGFKVLKASGSVEALQINMAHRAPIHLMLVDLILRPPVFQLQDGKERHPRVHGHEFIERVLQLRKTCHVVYMSGHDEQALNALGIRIGDALCLQKPFSREDLLGAIDMVLASPPLTTDRLPRKPLKKAANDR